jgi:hypothetical protein
MIELKTMLMTEDYERNKNEEIIETISLGLHLGIDRPHDYWFEMC